MNRPSFSTREILDKDSDLITPKLVWVQRLKGICDDDTRSLSCRKPFPDLPDGVCEEAANTPDLLQWHRDSPNVYPGAKLRAPQYYKCRLE